MPSSAGRLSVATFGRFGFCPNTSWYEENPYKFLQEGNVLIIDESLSLGFEWSNVIVFEKIADNAATLHNCNYMMRCTTNLIVVERRRWIEEEIRGDRHDFICSVDCVI